MTTRPTFGAWLEARLQRREMRQSELAAMLAVRPGVVSHWVHNKRLPSWDNCYALADALDLPPEHVLVAAGRIPGDVLDGVGEAEDRLVATFRRLSEEGREAVLQFVEFQRGRER